MSFTTRKPGVRKVQTNRDDTLQLIALRELGSASRWVELANLNALRPPYIVNDRVDLKAGVLLAGDMINIPAPTGMATVASDADGVFLRDIKLTNGRLTASGGDLVPVGGVDNLTQALQIRIQTDKKELPFHPEYGCYVDVLRGRAGNPVNNALAAFFVMSSLLEDERVKSVDKTDAIIGGDSIMVESLVTPIFERPMKLIAVVK